MNYIEMVASKEAREKEREDNRQTQAKIFLQLAREKFPRVPKRLERQIRTAKLEQINDWLSRLLTADDLASLIAAPAKG